MLSNVKSVLIGLTEEDEERRPAALGYGLSLAQQAGAHATIQAASLKVTVGSTFVGGFAKDIVASHNRKLRELAHSLAERARGEALAAGVNASVQAAQLSYGELVEAFVTQARVHDIGVLDGDSKPINTDRGLIEALLMEAGRPVIVVPAGCDTFRCDKILIGWDASARAARAVNDAMPFLKAAKAVRLVSVATERELAHSIPGAELAPHLSRHGVNVEVKTVTLDEGGIAGALRAEIEDFNADLMVMGAYKHSVLREWILGGVTHSLLSESNIPLFMSY